MFNKNIDERKDIIISKLEYSKKKKFLDNEPSFQDRILIINKAINDEPLTQEEFKRLISQLEFSFRKKLLERFNSNEIDNRKLEDYKTKTDKAIYIFENLKSM